MRLANPLEHPVVVLQGAGAHPSGEHDDVGLRHVLEGGVDGEPEHAILAANLAPTVTDEGHVDRRDALQHLVRAHAVQGGEPLEEGDRDVQCVAHAGVLSPTTTRKRRR
jgi:hypothetical protein